MVISHKFNHFPSFSIRFNRFNTCDSQLFRCLPSRRCGHHMPSVQVPCFAIRIGTMSSHPLDLRLVVVACHLKVPKTASQGIVIWLQTAWNGLQLRRCKKKHIAFQCSKTARMWAQPGNHHDQKSMKIDGELGAAMIIPWISEWRVFSEEISQMCRKMSENSHLGLRLVWIGHQMWMDIWRNQSKRCSSGFKMAGQTLNRWWRRREKRSCPGWKDLPSPCTFTCTCELLWAYNPPKWGDTKQKRVSTCLKHV